MKFTSNPIKNATNIADRKLPMAWAEMLFNDDMLVTEDTRKAYPERRFIGYNKLDGRLMVVVFCKYALNHTHIISFRKANKREQKKYENAKQN